MYDQIGMANITVGYSFLNKALSDEAVEEAIIGSRDFLKIRLIKVDEDSQTISFECDVYQHLLN